MRYLRSKAGNTHLLLPASYCKYLQTPLYLILSDISFTVQFIWWQGQSVRDLFPPASARPTTNLCTKQTTLLYTSSPTHPIWPTLSSGLPNLRFPFGHLGLR